MDSSTILTLRDVDALKTAIGRSPLKPPAIAAQAGLSVSRIYQLAKGHAPSVAGPAAVALAACLEVNVAALFTFRDGPELVRLGLVDA